MEWNGRADGVGLASHVNQIAGDLAETAAGGTFELKAGGFFLFLLLLLLLLSRGICTREERNKVEIKNQLPIAR
jgi:hypothetical protein